MSAKLPLSAEARAILTDAKTQGGRIHVLQADGLGKGAVLDARNRFAQDIETRRRQWDALQDLVAAGLVDKLSDSWYELTREGWEFVKEL